MTLATHAADRKLLFFKKDDFDQILREEPRPLTRLATMMLICRRVTFTMREIAQEAGWTTSDVWDMLVHTSGPRYRPSMEYDPPITALLTVDSRITIIVKGAE